MTRVLITGCRHWAPAELIESILLRLKARYGDDLIVCHGDCPTGVDATFKAACDALDIAQEPHPARWDELGNRAGPVRNAEMIDASAAFLLAFHRDLRNSKGTGGCVRLAIAANIAVWHYDGKGGEPRRLRRWEDVT